MLYHLNGKEAPEDCYYHPRLPRELMKGAFLRIVHCKTRKQTLGSLRSMLRESKVPNISAHGLLESILDTHPIIKDGESPSLWKRLQHLESTIAVNIMDKFAKERRVCLGIHDSFVVELRYRDLLRETMTTEYQRMMKGFSPEISES
jgi:hypothetical protein